MPKTIVVLCIWFSFGSVARGARRVLHAPLELQLTVADRLEECFDLLCDISRDLGFSSPNGGDAVDTRGATGRLMLNMFAAMAQFEREMMLAPARGHREAKAEGKYKGRKPTARLKAAEAVWLYRGGKRVAHIGTTHPARR